MTLRIDIWSDVNCPWCYIGKRRFEEGLRSFVHADEVEVTWHAYLLDPSLPERFDGTEAEYLAQMKGMSPEQVEGMLAQVTEAAASVGLDYHFEKLVPAQSLRAHALVKAAALHGKDASAVKEALLSAHFVEGRVTSDEDVLVEIGASVGLSEEVVRSSLTDRQVLGLVQEDITTAQRIGVTGVPFFVFDQKYAVSGAQQAEVFTQVLERAWTEAHGE